MGMRRDARRHDTAGSRQHEAVRTDQWWEYRPEQRVLTIDGPGRVIAVHDGPFPGAEEYEITLEGGLGGGRYMPGQIAEAPSTTAELHTAADDYPELGSVLVDRPDPATLSYTASMDSGGGAPAPGGAEGSGDDSGAGDEHGSWAPEYNNALYHREDRLARSINGEHVDDHGTAPDWTRAGNPNVYDRQSTEGEPDPEWIEDARQRQQAMAAHTPPGWEGAVGPFPHEYGDPHVYARDIHSGAGNCVCGAGPDDGLHLQAAPGVERRTARAFEDDDKGTVYLRFGHWPKNERSDNGVTGHPEEGVSVYDLNKQGDPEDPDAGLNRWHEHSHSCEPDCDLDQWNEEYGNDTGDEMRGRVDRAERARRSGVDRKGEVGHLVKGKMVGIGHDGEPLLQKVRRVGDWIDHRHLFVPGAAPHHLARTPDDEDYAPPEGQGPLSAHSHLTLGPDPKDELAAAQHLIEHHGYTTDQLLNLENPGQGDPFTAEHSLEHDLDFERPGGGSFSGGEEEGEEHVHNSHPEPAGLKDFPQIPKDYHPGWGGAHNPHGDLAKTEPAGVDPHVPLHSLSSLPSVLAHDWVGFPDEDDDARRHLVDEHGIGEDYIYAPHEQHDRTHEEIDEAEYHDPDLHGVPHEHRTVDRKWSPMPWEGKERSGGSTYDDADRRALAPINTEPFTPLQHSLSMLVTAAADAEFRFHVTAAWSDVRAKAKRIRAEGGVHITHSSDLIVMGNVQGDHDTYETGLQRVPGQRQSVALYSCGCKWGAYHWGAPDDTGRFGGRMCSHALALQYEAASRGMFGRDIDVDDVKPKWVPSKVVVKYDIDNGQHIRATSSVPEQAPLLVALATAADDDPVWTVLAAAYDMFGDTSYVEPSLISPLGPTEPRNPEENPASAGPLSSTEPRNWGRIPERPPMRSYIGSALGKEAFWQALIPAARMILPKLIKSVVPSLIDHKVRENAGSAKPAGEVTVPDGTQATMHDEPEGALPETDGEEHTATLGDVNLTGGSGVASADPVDTVTDGVDLNTMSGDALSPDDQSMQTQGSVEAIVAEFQRSAAAKSLMTSGKAGADPGGNGDIAAAAEAHLAKVAGSTFSRAEQDALINEAPGVQASNVDRLVLEGTHYAEIDRRMADGQEENALWWI